MSLKDEIKDEVNRRAIKHLEETAKTEIWIDRYGKIHKNENIHVDIISHHSEIAHYLYPDMDFPEDYLMKLGWVRISSISGVTSGKEPTQSQINKLFDLYGEIKVKVY